MDCRWLQVVKDHPEILVQDTPRGRQAGTTTETDENEITVLYPFVPTVLFMGIPSNWFKDATSALVMHLGRIRQMFRIDASKRLCRPRLICSILCCMHHCCQRLGAAYSSMCHHSWTWSRSLKSFEEVSSVSRVSFKSVSSIMYSLRCNVRVTCVSCRMLFRFLQALEHLHERRIVHRTDLRAATKSDFPTNGLTYERYWRNRTRMIRKNMLQRCDRGGNNCTFRQLGSQNGARWHQARKCTARWERLCQGSLPVSVDAQMWWRSRAFSEKCLQTPLQRWK